MEIKALRDYVAKRGMQQWLADAIGVPSSCIWDWKTGRFAVPVKHAFAIERVTNGRVTLKDLRPHDWRSYQGAPGC